MKPPVNGGHAHHAHVRGPVGASRVPMEACYCFDHGNIGVPLVKQLLADTDLPLKQVARRAGFPYTEYMMRVLRRATGQAAR